MGKKIGIGAFFGAICLICLLAAGCGKADPQAVKEGTPQAKEQQRKVLVVHSYHHEYEWVATVNRGIEMAILPSNTTVEYYYMDTKRHTDAAWMQKAGQEVMTLIDEWQPDVVLTVDDNAQECVGRHLVGRERPAVVFCGVNAEAEAYGYPASNVTGVLERLHFNESLAFFKKLCPAARRVVLLSDDSSTSRGVVNYVKTLPKGVLEVVDMVMPATFKEWKQAVEYYGDQVDAIAVYTYHTVKPDEGEQLSMVPREVMEWTVQNSKVPIIGFLVFSVDDGSLCGVLESGVEQGQLAGQMAVEILNGKRPADLPIVIGIHGQTMVNMKMADRLGLKLDPEVLGQANMIVGKEE